MGDQNLAQLTPRHSGAVHTVGSIEKVVMLREERRCATTPAKPRVCRADIGLGSTTSGDKVR